MLINYNAQSLNPPEVEHNLRKAVDIHLGYPANFVHVGNGEPVCFTKYMGFCISGVLIVYKHLNTIGTSSQYRLCRGVRRVGFQCI